MSTFMNTKLLVYETSYSALDCESYFKYETNSAFFYELGCSIEID